MQQWTIPLGHDKSTEDSVAEFSQCSFSVQLQLEVGSVADGTVEAGVMISSTVLFGVVTGAFGLQHFTEPD